MTVHKKKAGVATDVTVGVGWESPAMEFNQFLGRIF